MGKKRMSFKKAVRSAARKKGVKNPYAYVAAIDRKQHPKRKRR